MARMQTSDQGLGLIMQREGCRLTPYQDTVGVWTDGVGNTHGVVPNGPPITMEKAVEDLRRNMAWVEGSINSKVLVPLEQFEFDALASFVFNVGEGQFASSTLLRLLNEGRPRDEVAAQFDRWHVPPSIITRRNGEREQFKGTAFEPTIE